MLPCTKSNLCSILFLEQVIFQYSKYFFEIYWGCFRSSLERVPPDNYSLRHVFVYNIIHKEGKAICPFPWPNYPNYHKSSIKPLPPSQLRPLSLISPPFQGKKVNKPLPPSLLSPPPIPLIILH